MLIQPAPMPEELDIGYLGRIMRINGYRSSKDVTDAMRDHLVGTDEKPMLHDLLRRMAGLSSEQFSLRHSTLPLRRGITSYFPEIDHGSQARRTLLLIPRKCDAAFFCEECVEADIRFHGVSYWRRDHQMPGQMWCSKHKLPLSFMRSGDCFVESPSQFLGKGEKIPLDWVEESQDNEYVLRFLDLSLALYERTKPLSVPVIASLLSDLGRAKGFKTNPGLIEGDLISDRIRELFPAQWLSSVFHEVLVKTPGAFLHQIDGALYLRTAASNVTAYLLVLAVLFESADDAMNALSRAGSGDAVAKAASKRRRNVKLDSSVLFDLYVEARGSHRAVAESLKLSDFIVGRALCDQGLPHIAVATPEADTGAFAGLCAFYLQKQSFGASKQISGLSGPRFEALLRTAGPNLTRALAKMSPQIKQRPRAWRTKGLLPRQ
ncbi:TniQ family protein, partial [Comamonas thiooxydans]|uniref:TniQ family protein n=1 Tax=Comamonas thiooxydans TaxID=363952 RepID=UPI00244A150E